MQDFEIIDIDDLLDFSEISDLPDEDVIPYGEAVAAWADIHADELDAEEQKLVLQNARYTQKEAELRLTRKKLELAQRDAVTRSPAPASTPAAAAAPSHTPVGAWITAMICLFLSCVALAAEIGSVFFAMPVPMLPAFLLCIVFGVLAWVFSGRL